MPANNTASSGRLWVVFLAIATAGLFLITGNSGETMAGISDQAPSQVVPPEPSPRIPSPSIWSNPLGPDGEQVASVRAADLAYQPNIPDRVPDEAQSLLVTKIGVGAAGDREVAWVYDDPGDGRYFVLEQVVDYTQDALEEPAQHQPGCIVTPHPDGGFSYACYPAGFWIRTIRGDVRALVADGEEVKSVTWLESVDGKVDPAVVSAMRHPVLEVRVMGPAQDVTIEQLIKVADGV